jgi:hypothetical protein
VHAEDRIKMPRQPSARRGDGECDRTAKRDLDEEPDSSSHGPHVAPKLPNGSESSRAPPCELLQVVRCGRVRGLEKSATRAEVFLNRTNRFLGSSPPNVQALPMMSVLA